MLLFCVAPFVLFLIIDAVYMSFGREITNTDEIFAECFLYIVILFWIIDGMHRYNVNIKINFLSLLKEIRFKDIFFNVILNEFFSITLIMIIIFAFTSLFPQLTIYLGNEISTQSFIKNEINYKYYCLFDFLILVILAPVTEEIIFRGIIFEHMKLKFGIKKAIIFSSFIFGFLHMNINIIGAFTFGILSTLLYIKTQKITSSIASHSLNNFITYIAGINVSVSNEHLNMQQLLSLKQMIIPLAAVSIIIFILFLRFRWVQSLKRISI